MGYESSFRGSAKPGLETVNIMSGVTSLTMITKGKRVRFCCSYKIDLNLMKSVKQLCLLLMNPWWDKLCHAILKKHKERQSSCGITNLNCLRWSEKQQS